MPWYSQGRLTNPNANAIVADTGPLPVGTTYQPQVIVSSTVAAQILVQRRDAANAATISEQLVVCPANSTFELPMSVNMSDWQDNQRIRLILNQAITGTVQGSLLI